MNFFAKKFAYVKKKQYLYARDEVMSHLTFLVKRKTKM